MAPKGVSLAFLSICFIVIFSTVFLFTGCGGSAPDPKKTQNVSSITFKKVLQIEARDDTFYFKYPKRIYADPEENVYVLDGNRVLRFSREGTFTGDLVKPGQGPAEANNISNIYLTEGEIIIHNNYPSKIIRLDNTGTFLKEHRLNNSDLMKLIHYYNNTHFFLHSEIPATSPNNSYVDVDDNLSVVPEGGKEREKIFVFPVKKYVIKHGGGLGSFGIGQLLYAAFEGRYLFVSHTIDYKIKCFDIKEKKVIREFGVEYQRKEIPKELSARFNRGAMGLGGKVFRKPVQKYFNDIQKLLIHDKNLWVVTSEVDEKKGVRVDVYNFEGKNLGRFNLLLPGSTDMYSFRWTISGDYLYSIEKDKEDNPIVIKYRIIR
ncbi:MAG: hypothetical protein GY940_07790 [bacterium]|nr:hypothetical protein [bacterium]